MSFPPPADAPHRIDDRELRAQLLAVLEGEGARTPFDEAVEEFPDDAINRLTPNGSVSPWHILEHLRLTQWDILDYITNPAYVEPHWPEDYWPLKGTEATRAEFEATIGRFRADNAALQAIVRDRATDLTAPLAHTPGHTILREIRIVADHNSYHIGEFAILRQVMGTWGPNRR